MALNGSHRSAAWRGQTSSSVRLYSERMLKSAHIRPVQTRFVKTPDDTVSLEGLVKPKPKPTTQPADNLVRLNIKKATAFGQIVKAIGNSMVFGAWAVESALPLTWTPEGWVGEVRLPPGAYEFKVIVCDEASGHVDWEGGSNRLLEVPAFPGVLDVEHTWDAPTLITRFTDTPPPVLDPIELAARLAAAEQRGVTAEMAEAEQEAAEAKGERLMETRQAVLSDIKRLMDEDRPSLSQSPDVVAAGVTVEAADAPIETPAAIATQQDTSPAPTAAPPATPLVSPVAGSLDAASALPVAMQLVEDAAAVAAILAAPTSAPDTLVAAPAAAIPAGPTQKPAPAARASAVAPHALGSIDSADTMDEPAVSMTMENFHTMSPAMVVPTAPLPPTPTPPAVTKPVGSAVEAAAEGTAVPAVAEAAAAAPEEGAAVSAGTSEVQQGTVTAQLQANNVLPVPGGMSEAALAVTAPINAPTTASEAAGSDAAAPVTPGQSGAPPPLMANLAETPAGRALNGFLSFLANGGKKR